MTIVNKSLDWIRNHFDKDKVNKFSIVVIMIYYYVGLLSYITNPWWQIYRWFIASNPVSIVVRALLTASLCLYALLVVIVNKEKIQWKWAVVFIYILLFTLLSTALSPQEYSYIYVSGLYSIVHKVEVVPGFSRLATMYFSSISDFAIAFCLLFIFPLVINSKKQILVLLLPIVVIGILECGYSIIVEKDEYKKLIESFNSAYGGYQINIGATFGNKQDWGAFATLSFASALFSFALIGGSNLKRIVIKCALVFLSFILLFFTVASLCKTAIISEILIFLFFLLYLTIKSYKLNKILFFIIVSFMFLFLLVFVLVLAVPQIQNLPIINKVYQLIDAYFLKRISWNTLWGRTSLWYKTVSNMRTYNLFFGLSKGGVNAYSQVVIVEGQTTLHNGFAYFMLSYGIMGFAVYLLLLSLVIKRLLVLMKYNYGISLSLLGCLAAAIVFTLVESEVVVVSGSNPIFIFNVLLCSFGGGYCRRLMQYE